MLVNLSEAMAAEGCQMKVSVPLEMTVFHSKTGDFPITRASDVSLTVTGIGEGRVRISGGVHLDFQTVCDRCLKETATSLDLVFDRTAASPELDVGEDSEDYAEFMEGYRLNVETFVHNEILMNWPMKILCRSDCKGVCPVCGKDLNEGDCGCDPFVPDPRMAAIQEIFNANKEV